MSLNRLLADQPQPEIAGSARLFGRVHVSAGAILAQGTVVRSHDDAVSIGNHSAVLENGVVVGNREHPVRIGQRTVFGHRAQIIGATVGDLCEIGNGAILMPGARLGNGCILGEGTLVPAGAVIPPSTVLVGRPPHAIQTATDADRERLAVLREHQTDLTDFPGHRRTAALQAGAHMGTLYAYRDKEPVLGAGTVLFDSAEITGDVVVGKDSLIGAGVKIIGDSHGPVRIGSRVQILENAVLHLLPDNELVIEDDVVIGPGAMIHGCHIGRGTVVEPAAIVCDFSTVGPESIVRAGACVKQRAMHPARSVLDGFPARTVDTLAPAPGPSVVGAASRRCQRHPPHRPLTMRLDLSGVHVSLTAEYDRLFIDKQSPDAYRAMSAVASEVSATAQAAGLDRLLVELVNIRVSQLNGCGFCLDLHVRRAVKNGETPQRLAVLPAWRDVDLFSPTERAALALAEAITNLPEHDVRERERTCARDELTADQFSAVSWLAITMNAFNRISIISGHPVRPRTA